MYQLLHAAGLKASS